jgi:hypothetical protein
MIGSAIGARRMYVMYLHSSSQLCCTYVWIVAVVVVDDHDDYLLPPTSPGPRLRRFRVCGIQDKDSSVRGTVTYVGFSSLCCYYYYYYCMSCIREDPIPLHGDPGMKFHSCAFLRLARDCNSTDIACTRAREFMPMLKMKDLAYSGCLLAYSSLRSLDEPID